MLSSRHFVTACVMLFCAAVTRSQTVVYWNNASPDFTATSSWTGPMVNDTVSSIAAFSGSAYPLTQPLLSMPWSVAGLRFDSSAGAYILGVEGAGSLTIGSKGIQNLGSTATQTIQVPLVFETAASIVNDGTLVIAGAVTNNISAGLVLDGFGRGTISGPIGGTGSIAVEGGAGSEWILSGINTYSGSTSVTGGTLFISADANLGAVPVMPTVGSLRLAGGTLATTATFALAANRGISLSGTGTTIQTGAGTVLTYAGRIEGSGGLNKTGTGTLDLGGVNTYVGGTRVLEGTLKAGAVGVLPSSGQLAVAGGATAMVNADQTVAGLSDFDWTGGSVAIAGGAKLAITGPGNFSGVISGAGALVLNPSSFQFSQTLSGANTYTGGTFINAGMLMVTNTTGSATGTGPITIANGALLQLGNNAAGGAVSGDITNDGNILFASTDTTATYGGVISGSGSLSIGRHDLSTPGTLTLTGANTYTGQTSINAGTLRIGGTNTLPVGTQLWFGSDAVLDVAADQTLARLNGDTTATVRLGSGATLTVAPAASTYGGRFAGLLEGAGNLTLAGGAGTGFAVLGNNTYTGNTTVSGGTLYVGDSAALGTGSLTLQSNTGLGIAKEAFGDVTLPNTVTLGTDVTIGGDDEDKRLALSGTVWLAAGASTLRIEDFVHFKGTLKSQSGSSQLTLRAGEDGSATAVVTGAFDSSVTSLSVDGSAMIFGSATAVPAAGSLSIKGTNGYVGIAAVSGSAPSASSVLGLIDPTAFTGAFGFDSPDENMPPAVFADAVDLSDFGGNVTLGSTSAAVLTGTITPSAAGYLFGNGGGALVVSSQLTGANNVTVSSVTGIPGNYLIAAFREGSSGPNNYTGNLSVTNSLAVLDSPTAMPATATVTLGEHGYVGYTEAFTGVGSVAEFIAARVTAYTSSSVIGIDSSAYISDQLAFGSSSSSRWFGETVDLRNLNSVYLGTATSTVLGGLIYAPAQGTAAQTLSLLAGHDAELIIDAPLVGGYTNSVVVGSATSPYAGGTVTLNGSNTFAGGTTLAGGTLVLGSSTHAKDGVISSGALGTGTLTVASNTVKPTLAAGEYVVTVGNPLALGSALRIGLPYDDLAYASEMSAAFVSGGTLVFNGVIGDFDAVTQGSLEIFDSTLLNAPNTFTGGVTVYDGTLMLGHDAALGSGTLTFSPGSFDGFSSVTLSAVGGTRTIANNLVYAGVPRGTVEFSGEGRFVFTGSLTLQNDVEFLAYQHPVRFDAAVGGFGRLIGSGSGSIVLAGANTYTGGTEAEYGSIIFANPGAMPATPNINAFTSNYGGYIGIAFVPSNLQAAFIDRFDKGRTVGAIGLDSASTSAPNTFTGAIDLRGFSYSARLGSASRAILTGTITPQGYWYNFGDGGGLLEVESAMGDEVSTSMSRTVSVISDWRTPLTLRLKGSNTYTGGTSVSNSGVIFGVGALPSYGLLAINSGAYAGTEDAAFAANPNGFIGRFDPTSTDGIVGFDSFGGSPFSVTGDLSLAHFTSATDPEIFLGTATAATISGNITLPAYQAAYRFAGYKGGKLTVSSQLTGMNSVVIGSYDSLATFGVPNDPAAPLSSVTLTGGNTYVGGTTLEAGVLYVGHDSALGTGAVTISSDGAVEGWRAGLLSAGGARTISNPVLLGGYDLDLGGVFDLSLTGAISGSGALYKVGTGMLALSGDNSARIGDIRVTEGGITFVNASSVGQGILEFDGASAVSAAFLDNSTVYGIAGFNGNETINLTAAKTLTVHQTFDSEYAGTFAGSTAGLVFNGGGYRLRLTGASAYTGTTTIQEGVAVIAGNTNAFGASTNTVALAGGKLVADVGVTVSNPLNITAGALGGSGTFKAASSTSGFAIGAGVVLAPGMESAGLLSFDGTLISTSVLLLGAGGSYHWDVVNATTAGGWDVVSVNGAVSITATEAAPFRFSLASISPDGTPGFAANFDPTQAYSWDVLTATEITGFTGSNQFAVDTTHFANPNAGVFSFSLNGSGTGTSLTLNFNPVPEPSTYALILAGLGLTYLASRRRS